MSDEELRAFLAEERIMVCATMGANGRPHLMPLWYVPDGLTMRGWTFAKSQKARNLERDPRATVQVEAGVEYAQLRGAMLECDVEIERETDAVAGYGRELFGRYAAEAGDAVVLEPADAREAVLAAAERLLAPSR